MRIQKTILSIIGVVLTSLSLAADDTRSREISYHGPSKAVGVCRAIANDNPDRLRHQLSLQRRRMTWGYQYGLLSEEVAGSFTCNEMELIDFAASIGAEDVTRYLATGEVDAGTQVTSADD